MNTKYIKIKETRQSPVDNTNRNKPIIALLDPTLIILIITPKAFIAIVA